MVCSTVPPEIYIVHNVTIYCIAVRIIVINILNCNKFYYDYDDNYYIILIRVRVSVWAKKYCSQFSKPVLYTVYNIRGVLYTVSFFFFNGVGPQRNQHTNSDLENFTFFTFLAIYRFDCNFKNE